MARQLPKAAAATSRVRDIDAMGKNVLQMLTNGERMDEEWARRLTTVMGQGDLKQIDVHKVNLCIERRGKMWSEGVNEWG
jgi:hypothetical protein